MYPDVTELRRFYATPLGLAVRDGIKAALERLASRDEGARTGTVGLGYAMPYLHREPERTVVPGSTLNLDLALMPAAQGVFYWPRHHPNRAALVDETALPLTNGFAERLLVVHALEHALQVDELLKELWRILAPGGRLILVVPHRRTMWSSRDISPFAQGRPYSRAQLRRLLEEADFSPFAEEGALFGIPGKGLAMVRQLRAMEKPGRLLWPGFSGVLVVEAEKRVFAPIGKRKPAREAARARGWVPAGQRGVPG